MELFDRDIRLAIFDMDGTLIDSTSIWAEIDRDFFKRRGKDVPAAYADEIAHIGLMKAAAWTKEHYFPDEKEEDILNEWRAMSIEAYEKTIPLKDGAKRILESFKSKGVHLALATANSEELYLPCLTRLGIIDYFESINDVSKMAEGKNSSKIYDSITKQFGLAPSNVLVIEDILSALTTADNAGYCAIGVYDKKSAKDESAIRKHCCRYFYSLDEFADLL